MTTKNGRAVGKTYARIAFNAARTDILQAGVDFPGEGRDLIYRIDPKRSPLEHFNYGTGQNSPLLIHFFGVKPPHTAFTPV